MRRPETKIKAFELRKQGYSLKEIALKLGIAKGTASMWVKVVPISESGYNRLREKTKVALAKAHKTITNRNDGERLCALNSALQIITKYSPIKPELARLLTAILYWCEGTKSADNTLKFANSDPVLVQFFLTVFRQGFNPKIEKFKAILHLHEYHNEPDQIKFWSKITGIPSNQFYRSYHKPHTGKRIKPDYPGCITVNYYDKIVAREVFGLIKAFGQVYK